MRPGRTIAGLCAAALAAALGDPARAADLGIPIDVFTAAFNARAKAMAAPVVAADPVCVERVSCYSALPGGVALLTGTAPDSDMVREVDLVSSSSPAGFAAFSDACVALVGLLSPELPEAERRAFLHAMDADALAHGAADHAVPGKVRYDIALRDDARLVFRAVR